MPRIQEIYRSSNSNCELGNIIILLILCLSLLSIGTQTFTAIEG